MPFPRMTARRLMVVAVAVGCALAFIVWVLELSDLCVHDAYI